MDSGNAVDWFIDRHVAMGDGARLAFRDPWRSLTYQDLATATRRFAGALALAGIGREQRMVLLLQDTIDFPIAFWGAMRAGVRAAALLARPFARDGFVRSAPGLLGKWTATRDLRAPVLLSFRRRHRDAVTRREEQR